VCTIPEFARPHTLEQINILGNRAITERTIPPRLSESSSALPHFFCTLAANKRLAINNQLFRKFKQLIKVV
jgi:hypothetical protein